METKNVIIRNFAQTICGCANSIYDTSNMFGDNIDENLAIVSALNVKLEAMRSDVVLLQQALDKYS